MHSNNSFFYANDWLYTTYEVWILWGSSLLCTAFEIRIAFSKSLNGGKYFSRCVTYKLHFVNGNCGNYSFMVSMFDPLIDGLMDPMIV